VRAVQFDDLVAVTGLASEHFGAWGSPRVITQDMIDQFSAVTGDDQWIHTDLERAARESPFGGPIAHGFLVLSLVSALPSGADYGIVGHKLAVNYGLDRVRFVAPVPAGAAIHSRGRIVSAAARGGGTLVTYETEVAVVNAPKPSLICRPLALYL
jgi:acyl dehydratase